MHNLVYYRGPFFLKSGPRVPAPSHKRKFSHLNNVMSALINNRDKTRLERITEFLIGMMELSDDRRLKLRFGDGMNVHEIEWQLP